MNERRSGVMEWQLTALEICMQFVKMIQMVVMVTEQQREKERETGKAAAQFSNSHYS